MSAPRPLRGHSPEGRRGPDAWDGPALARAPSDDRPDTPTAAARRIAATLLDIARTRVELAGVEWAEQRARFARQALAWAAALLLLAAGLVLGVIALAWIAAPESRAMVLGGGAALLLVLGAASAWGAHRMAQRAPPLLRDTLEQLRADARALLP